MFKQKTSGLHRSHSAITFYNDTIPQIIFKNQFINTPEYKDTKQEK